MRKFIVLIFTLVILAGIGSGIWWFIGGVTPQEQLKYLKVTFDESVGGRATNNTAQSASKLGRVLKGNFEEAQDVYQNGAEAKYE